MSTHDAGAPPVEESARATLKILDELLKPELAIHVGIRLWDGSRWPDAVARRTTIALQHAGSLRAMFVPMNEMTMSEAYLRDDYDIEGSIQDVFDFLMSLGVSMGPLQKAKTAINVLRLPRGEGKRLVGRAPAKLSGKPHSPERDKQAVAYHYNMPNDFYALWLDPTMTYSCAYFQTLDNSPQADSPQADSPQADSPQADSPQADSPQADSLQAAQTRKLDMICRKLRLKPGQKLLDIGCGWGGLVMHAARHYGVDATGITLGDGQAELAQNRIAKSDFSDRCRVILKDYREVDEPETYDVLVSIGMSEHVGEANIGTYFANAWKLLKPRGVFLNHGITRGPLTNAGKGPSFIDSYVFPDGELIPLPTVLRAAEEAGWEIRDVEDWREHYAQTLRLWVRNLEQHHQQAIQLVDEASYRAWRLYMASSAMGFDIQRVKIYQTLLAKPDERGRVDLPLTRDDWYA